MVIGNYSRIKVHRLSDYGYMLRDPEANRDEAEDVLMHFNDTDRELMEGKYVTVFIYIDSKGRPSATTFHAKCTTTKFEWCEVVNVTSYGVFVNIGIKKDILVSDSELPTNKNLWPKVGDVLYVKLEVSNDKLFAILARKNDFDTEPATKEEKNLMGRVFKIHNEGVNVLFDNKTLGFLYHANSFDSVRLGEYRDFFINSIVKEEYDLVLRKQKELQIKDDKQVILDYLENNKYLLLTDKSSPDEIKSLLKMSKSGFKRAVGNLLKEEKIVQDKDKGRIERK